MDACFCAYVARGDGCLMTALLLSTVSNVSSVPVPVPDASLKVCRVDALPLCLHIIAG